MIKKSCIFLFIIPLLLSAKAQIQIHGKTLLVEIVQKKQERTKGLMHRRSLGENEGMLFIFDNEQMISFWMKNTHIPLSLAFFNEKKELVQIEKMDPQKKGPYKLYTSVIPIKYALEVNQGWFEKNQVPLMSTFEVVCF